MKVEEMAKICERCDIRRRKDSDELGRICNYLASIASSLERIVERL